MANQEEAEAQANSMPAQSFHLLLQSAEALAEESRRQATDAAVKARAQVVHLTSVHRSRLLEATATALEAALWSQVNQDRKLEFRTEPAEERSPCLPRGLRRAVSAAAVEEQA